MDIGANLTGAGVSTVVVMDTTDVIQISRPLSPSGEWTRHKMMTVLDGPSVESAAILTAGSRSPAGASSPFFGKVAN